MATSFRRPIEVIRGNPGTYIAGHWQPAPGAVQTVMATVQPMTLSDLDKMAPTPEGRRVEHAIRVYTDEPLIAAGEGPNGGDQVLWPPKGDAVPQRLYRVVARADWRGGTSLSHYRHTAIVEG